jgi:hypothetical protein
MRTPRSAAGGARGTTGQPGGQHQGASAAVEARRSPRGSDHVRARPVRCRSSTTSRTSAPLEADPVRPGCRAVRPPLGSTPGIADTDLIGPA